MGAVGVPKRGEDSASVGGGAEAAFVELAAGGGVIGGGLELGGDLADVEVDLELGSTGRAGPHGAERAQGQESTTGGAGEGELDRGVEHSDRAAGQASLTKYDPGSCLARFFISSWRRVLATIRAGRRGLSLR